MRIEEMAIRAGEEGVDGGGGVGDRVVGRKRKEVKVENERFGSTKVSEYCWIMDDENEMRRKGQNWVGLK